MDEILQSLPSVQDMVTQGYTPANWVRLYKNLWERNVIARTVDVINDSKLKAENPEEEVEYQYQGMPVKSAVKYRLEHRKTDLKKALETVETLKELANLSDEEIAKTYWTDEALAVAADIAAEIDADSKQVETVNYVVLAESGVTLSGTEDVTPKGTVIMLDPADAETMTLIESGDIALATAENTQEEKADDEQEQQEEKAADEQQENQEQQQEEVAQDSAPAIQNYNIVTDITVDGAVHAAGSQIELSEEQVAALPEGSVTLA